MFTSLPLGKCGLPCKAPLMTASGTNGGVVWCGVVVSGAVVGLGVVSATNRVHEPPAKPLSLRAPLRSKATNSWRSSSDDVTFTRLGSFFIFSALFTCSRSDHEARRRAKCQSVETCEYHVTSSHFHDIRLFVAPFFLKF